MGWPMVAAGWAAACVCVAAAIVAGVRLDGYSHALYPLGLLGARGVTGAPLFNFAGFILPGLLAAAVAFGLYRALPAAAGWLPRIGARLLLISGLGFAAQGLLPLDPQDLDSQVSGLHAAAWMVWWTAFVAGAPLLAVGLRPIGVLAIAVACVLLAMILVPSSLLEPPLAQRIALVTWLAWLALAPRQAFNRSGA